MRDYNGPNYLPACTEEGAQFYLAQLALKEENPEYKIQSTPREYVIPAVSFKKNKKEKKKHKTTFTKDKIRCRKTLRKRAKAS